jgi:hypothetical protein
MPGSAGADRSSGRTDQGLLDRAEARVKPVATLRQSASYGPSRPIKRDSVAPSRLPRVPALGRAG